MAEPAPLHRTALDALGDPNRRAILEVLADGPRSVQQIADRLPVSRPAVSRHLRLLKDAGLVVDSPAGARRLYALHGEGIDAVRDYFREVWGEAAARFRLAADNTRRVPQTGTASPANGHGESRNRARRVAQHRIAAAVTEPLIVEFTVRGDVEHAFAVWTERCALWWPASHTVSGDPAAIEFDADRTGRIVERAVDGTEHVWGEIVDWEPPTRLSYRWHLFFDPSEATDVEVTFTPADGGTAVRIRQTGWERLGAAGPPRRERTALAWSAIGGLYAQACS